MDRRTRWRALSEPRAATFDGEGEKGRGAAMNSQGERHTPREPKETHEVEVAAPLRVLPKTATTRRLMLDAGDSRKKSIFSKTYFSYTLDSQCFQGSNALFGGLPLPF